MLHVKQPKSSYEMRCMLLQRHPFTTIVSGPTDVERLRGCCELRLIDNLHEKIQPAPSRIWYYYGEHQPVLNEYPFVHFEEGISKLSDEVFDSREPSMIVVDDLM